MIAAPRKFGIVPTNGDDPHDGRDADGDAERVERTACLVARKRTDGVTEESVDRHSRATFVGFVSPSCEAEQAPNNEKLYHHDQEAAAELTAE
jgi:hypothetical protein